MTDDTARAALPYFEPFTCPECELWVAGHAEDCPLAAPAPDRAGLDVGNEWLGRLVKAERENHCGDAACMTRRVSAAVRVLTGGKEHQDYCWAVEAFEVKLGIRDPATVGPEPSGALLDAAHLASIGRLAIEYVAAGEKAWAEAKDPHETDDDLEPTWVAFRDAVLGLAARLREDAG